MVAAGFPLVLTNDGSIDCKVRMPAVALEAPTACDEMILLIRHKDGHQLGAANDKHQKPAEQKADTQPRDWINAWSNENTPQGDILMASLDRLDDMYRRWLEHEALPDTSAVELALQDFLTDSQRAWLERFTKLYAQMQQSTF